MSLNERIPTTYYKDGVLTNTIVNSPKVFIGQVELWKRLMANNIKVYIMSALSKEIIRMVASDPEYGYNLNPQNFISVALLTKNTTSGEVTSSREQITEGTYSQEANLDLVATPFLWTPAT